MFRRFLIKQHMNFLKKTSIGKIFNFFGKIIFGKIVFVTGYAPDGKEFYKSTTNRKLDKLFVTLKETGHTGLEEHTEIDSVENALERLATNRRSGN